MLRVISVQPLEGYRLRVAFNDGVERDVDCAFLLHGSLGEPLRDPEYFRQVRVDDEARTVMWPNGLDPAPELLHGDCKPAASEGTHSMTPAISRVA
ncbi:MAG TPA: DUF2442 domain-containing protein [Solirubrobacteraceae bacterium]|jgi:hypothetical protein